MARRLSRLLVPGGSLLGDERGHFRGDSKARRADHHAGSPLGEDLLKDGWSEESAAGIRTRLETFRREIDLLGDLPPIEQRPLGMVRALDFWGVKQGELVDELASFEHDLRRI
jgi:hypothetical protein